MKRYSIKEASLNESEADWMKRYLGWISLVLIILFIVLAFIIPQVLNPLPESLDLWLLILLLLGSFFTALFSVKGRLKTITLLISSLGMLTLLVLTVIAIGMILFGNFGT
ncbi:histidine kinase [Psychrobacillus sp. BM2]|uniref:histidine kinase n=1 Tax=Psychrobacillus sp. BM2 TaxID=3400421 RepID=UPI003B011673